MLVEWLQKCRATGTAGTALTVSGVALETQVLSVGSVGDIMQSRSDASNVLRPGMRRHPELYSYAPVGAVMTMVPVGIAHVG